MQQLDEKKHVIIPIVDRLRQFNPGIGNYQKSILNENFQYSVKLTNGRIVLPQELIQDFEQSADFITEEQYKSIALAFVPSQGTSSFQSDTTNQTSEVTRPQSYLAESSKRK